MAIIESVEFDPEYFVERRIFIDTMTGQQVPESEVVAMRDAEANARMMAELQAAAGREQAAREAQAQAAAYAEQLRIAEQQRAGTLTEEQARAQAAPAPTPFGQGMGQATGQPYSIQNAYGDEYQRFDAQGNLTEYLNKQGQWEKASDIKPIGVVNMPGGGYATEYTKPGFNGTFFSSTYAPMMSPFREDQGGWLGEGGWQRMAQLAAAGLSAGFAAPALSAIQGATGLGAVGAGALYGGATGALSGGIGGGAKGALQGGLLGAIGGGVSGALGGGGGAEAFPVDVPNSNFTGMDINNPATWGVGEFQPFAGGDVGLGSGYITQFNPDGSFITLPSPATSEYGYSADAGANEAGDVTTETFNVDQNTGKIIEEKGLMDRINGLFPEGAVGDMLKSALLAGGVAAASSLMPKQETDGSGSGAFTADQLQAIVAGMPSAMSQYLQSAQNAGFGGGFGQAAATLPNLFPNYALPTTGQYGAGRFMNIPTGGVKV